MPPVLVAVQVGQLIRKFPVKLPSREGLRKESYSDTFGYHLVGSVRER